MGDRSADAEVPSVGADGELPALALPRVERHELGILFVHGIGNQKRGDTLLAFGGALSNWLNAWVAGASRPRTGDRGSAAVSGTRLRRDDGGPARSLVTATLHRDDGSSQIHRWQMAESWWAEDFPMPGFLATAKWTFCVAPWVVQRHLNLRLIGGLTFADGFQRDRRLVRFVMAAMVPPSSNNLARAVLTLAMPVAPLALVLIRRAVAVILAVTLGLLAQISMVVLLLLSAVPYVRRLALRAHRLIAQTVGDSYALTNQPLVFDAMVSRIQDDIDWLADRCDKVAVVAHSQGAALAHEALSAESTANRVDLLVTFGAGIAKLRALTHLPVARSGIAFTMRLAGLTSLVGSALLGSREMAVGVALLVVGVTLLVWSAVLVPRFTEEQAPKLNIPGLGLRLRWIDLYASHDPVPEGRLSRQPPIGLSSRRVINRRSTLSDHTTYWSNVEGFIHPLCRELAATCGWANFDSLTSEDVRIAAAAETRRASRTESLSVAAFAFPVAATTICLFAGDRLEALGSAVLTGILTISPFLGWDEEAQKVADQGWAPAVVGVLIILGSFMAARNLALGAAWNRWDLRARDSLAARRVDPSGATWGVRVTLAALLGVVVATALVLQPADTGAPIVGWVLTALLGITALTAWTTEGDVRAVVPAALMLVEPTTQQMTPAGLFERFRYEAPLGLATCGTEIWTACGPRGVIVRTDAVTGDAIEIQLTGFTRAVAVSPEAAWVTTDDSLVRIARATSSVSWTSQLEPGLSGLAFGVGAVWVASAGSLSVLRVSPRDGHLEAVVGVPGEPSGVAVAGRSVWVTGPQLGLLIEIDSLTNNIVREIDLKGVPLGNPIMSQGRWWMYDMGGGLIEVDPSDGSVRHFSHSDPCIGGLTALDDRIWQANSWKGTLREYVDGEFAREIRVPGHPQEVGVVDGRLCVVSQEERT
jgi:hypothetical protein